MQPNYKILGKVCLTANGKWDKTKKYDKISIVFNDTDNTSYISRQDVPAGIEITNEDYWQVICNRGAAIVVDDKLNGISTNPIQNKAVYTAIQGLDGKIELINNDVTDLKTDNDFIKRDVTTLMNKVFPFKVAVSIDKALAQKGTTATANITVKAYQGDDITQVDAIIINGEEHHGNIPYTTQVTSTTNTTYNVRVEKDEVIPSIILQNKDESKRRSEIVEAYGKGIVYNDYLCGDFPKEKKQIESFVQVLRLTDDGCSFVCCGGRYLGRMVRPVCDM